jgi:plastocyanin
MTLHRHLVALCVISAGLVALAGCGSAASNEVDMGVAAFKQDSVTVNAGQAVHFVDSATGGGVHVLCIGQGLDCVPQSGAPAELNSGNGITFNPGDTRDFVFPNRGTYTVICTIHPGMAVAIIVQ